MHTFILFSK